ncbi:unnamed protein product [Oreochromis niloticus]|nr:unnamed protein product [Mustela putorius furo]
MEDPNDLHPEEIPGVRENLENNDAAAAAARIQQHLERENNVPLNIAITGEGGVGKSTFVNALRGLSNGDEGAAPTGVTETTIEVTPYPHPNYPNVKLWDLPGIATTMFPAKKYLKLVGFEKFDFFIIISADRFRENDVKLAQEIQKMKKKFYFVRSKIDENLRAEQRNRHFSEEETLTKIREDCVHRLRELGIESPQVFLVSSFELHLTGVPYADLRAVIISPLAAVEITAGLLMKVVTQVGRTATLIVAEEASRFIPVVGIPLAMGFSFGTTYTILKSILNQLADDAQKVFERASV